MSAKNDNPHFLLFAATMLMLAVLYLPQPLQAMLAVQYGRSPTAGGALTTVALIPLACAPLLYGYILGNRHPAELLRPALVAMALSCLALAAVDDFNMLLVIRFVQGALLPVLISAILYLLGDAGDVRKTLAVYVSCTVVGGFLGRIGAAAFAAWSDWRVFPVLCAVAFVLLAFAVIPPPAPAQALLRPRWADFAVLLRSRIVLTLCFIVFAPFSAFVAVLNYLPFIVRERFPDAGIFMTGLMYSGYLIGAVVSLLSPRIIRRVGLKTGFICASLLFVVSLAVLAVSGIVLTFAMLFALCAAIFLLHSTAIAEVNRVSPASRTLSAAFYTGVYYSGSVFGAFVPGLIYQHYGKGAFFAALIVAGVLGFCAIISLPSLPEEGK